MSTARLLAASPSCPACGWALGNVHRLAEDSTAWECPSCRRVSAAHEVFEG